MKPIERKVNNLPLRSMGPEAEKRVRARVLTELSRVKDLETKLASLSLRSMGTEVEKRMRRLVLAELRPALGGWDLYGRALLNTAMLAVVVALHVVHPAGFIVARKPTAVVEVRELGDARLFDLRLRNNDGGWLQERRQLEQLLEASASDGNTRRNGHV